MKTYTCTSFKGHYPVGTAAVVRGANAEEAAKRLNEELKEIGLEGNVQAKDLELFRAEDVRILNDGNY
jgi:hypothetical protein